MSDIREKANKIKNILFILFSAISLSISYNFNVSILGWLALIPLFYSLKNETKFKKIIFISFSFGSIFYIQALYWIIPTLQAGGVNIFLSIFALLLLSLTMSLEFIFIFALPFYFNHFGCPAWSLTMASSWTLIEFLKIQINKFAVWFPWFSLAYTQNNNLMPYTYYVGIYGITFIMVLFQASIAYSIEERKKTTLKIILFSLFVISSSYLSKKLVLNSPSQEKIKIAIIQPSVDYYKKWDLNYFNEIKKDIETLISSLEDKRIDLVIWPENALPGWIDDKDVFSWLVKLVKKTKAYHIVGSVSRIDGKHVSAFLISPDGEIIQEYNKRILVPFGEYVPLRNFLARYIDTIGKLGEFESGNENQDLFKIKNFKVGISICYESIFDFIFRNEKENGADFFVNITNDGWYLNTRAPWQHLTAASFRASENGIYLARAANNGISAFISPEGKILEKTSLNEKTIIIKEISKTNNKNTGVFKYSFIYLSLIIIFSLIIARIIL